MNKLAESAFLMLMQEMVLEGLAKTVVIKISGEFCCRAVPHVYIN